MDYSESDDGLASSPSVAGTMNTKLSARSCDSPLNLAMRLNTDLAL